jgi:hypothetical protein
LFSSSTIVHARRRDKIESNVTEEFDNEEEKEEEEEEETDTDQVILNICLIKLFKSSLLIDRLILL